jgi:hypothetical protein
MAVPASDTQETQWKNALGGAENGRQSLVTARLYADDTLRRCRGDGENAT